MSNRFPAVTVWGTVLLSLALFAGFYVIALRRGPMDLSGQTYPSDKWAEFRSKVDVKALAELPIQRRGRYMPADTFGRELNRHMSDREKLIFPTEDGKAGYEAPALTMFGLALAPQHYYDARIFGIVSTPLRRTLFQAKWTGLPDDKAAVERTKWLAVDRFFSYRDVAGALTEVRKLRTARMETDRADADRDAKAAAKAGRDDEAQKLYAKALTLADKIGERRAADERFAGTFAKLETTTILERLEFRKALFADFDGAVKSGEVVDEEDRKHLERVVVHLDDLTSKLESFDSVSNHARFIPTSTSPDGNWLSPDLMLGILYRPTQTGARMPSPETIELPAKFVLTDNFEEVDEAGLRRLLGAWKGLQKAFADADADKANVLVAEIAGIIRGEGEGASLGAGGRPLYTPSAGRLSLEVFYNSWGKFFWVCFVFFGSFLVLLAAYTFRSGLMLLPGLAMFGSALVLMITGFAFRMILADRGSFWSIPISNQFESLLWGMFFGTLVATAVCIVSRSWNGIACLIGASAAGTLIMGLSWLKPIGVSAELATEAPVLRAALLPFHVGSMVGGYAVIFLAFGMGLCYLLLWFRAGADAEEKIELTMVDRFHEHIIKLAFFLLLVGLILGAAWGDVAWGRWWGWDPKETWAFITWLVFAIVIHARIIVKDRGPLTACASIWGFVVMLFTWFGINYGLTTGIGLHAYSGSNPDDPNSPVAYIWGGVTLLLPLALGLSLAARSVHVSRTQSDAPGGRNLALFTLGITAALGATFGMLYAKYGTTPTGVWEWAMQTPAQPVSDLHVVPGLGSADDAKWWVPRAIIPTLWGLTVLGLSGIIGTFFAVTARKDRA